MNIDRVKIALGNHVTYLTLVLVLIGASVFAQKIDSNVISYKPKAQAVSKLPVIKGTVQPYKMNVYRYLNSNHTAKAGSNNKEKNEKSLTVLKIYPNPLVEQLNISLRLDKSTNLSIKITDLLGNEIVTLLNEKASPGEHTKTFNVPAKLNAGIYFLRIVAGGEPIIKRISVL